MFFWQFIKSRITRDPKTLGKWGENRSITFLRKKGLRLLEKNFTCKTGEIDLIMVCPAGGLVFVEVKTRSKESFATAESALTKPKKDRLTRTAHHFIQSYDLQDRPARFDLIAITLDTSKKPDIRHYENAFVP